MSAVSIRYQNECDQGGKIYRSNILMAAEKLDKNKAEECGSQEDVADCCPLCVVIRENKVAAKAVTKEGANQVNGTQYRFARNSKYE